MQKSWKRLSWNEVEGHRTGKVHLWKKRREEGRVSETLKVVSCMGQRVAKSFSEDN
jgi:hypothetical protein